jgi:hypothetical protein
MSQFEASISGPFTQLHGTDLLFRLDQNGAEGIVFEHGQSLQDADVLMDARQQYGPRVHRAVLTVWQARHEGRVLSLGWDWVGLEDERPFEFRLVSPRTNLKLVDARGYDLPAQIATTMLWELIGKLPWQDLVARAGAEPSHELCPPH